MLVVPHQRGPPWGGGRAHHQQRPDSVGRVAAVMLGSTETTFYTIAVYFGAVGISRTRYAVPAALCADLTGFLAAAWAVRLCFEVDKALTRRVRRHVRALLLWGGQESQGAARPIG